MDSAGAEVNYALDKLTLQRSRFTLNWINQLNVTPKVILDIGAYDGGDGIRFKREFPNAEVYSFEGCPERQRIIEEYINDYGVKLIKKAVTNHIGTTQWYSATCVHYGRKPVEKYAAQGSIYEHNNNYKQRHKNISQHEQIQVPCTSVAGFCIDHNIQQVDVAHIDTEGAEYYVVKGFGDIRPKIVYVETINQQQLWVDAKSIEELHDLLISMGYKLILDIVSDRLYHHGQ